MVAAPDRVWVRVYQPEPDQNRQPLRNEPILKTFQEEIRRQLHIST